MAPYIAILLLFWIITQWTANDAAENLRQDLNVAAARQCEAGKAPTKAIFGKYNDAIAALIADYNQREVENRERGDIAKAEINKATRLLLNKDFIEYVPPNCLLPLYP